MAGEIHLAPLRGQLGQQTLAELRRLMRVPEFTGFSLVFPVILYVFIGGLGGGRSDVDFHRYALASLASYAVVNVALFSIGVTVATERGARIDALLRASPVRPIVPLAAKVLTGLAFAAVSLAILYVAAILVGGVRLSAFEWFNLTWRLLVGMIPFMCMGFAFGYLAGPAAAVALINLVFLPMSFASGIFFPLGSLPRFIQVIAPYLPMYHLGHVAWNAVGVRYDDLAVSAVWLAGYGIVFLAAALWAVRREDDRRFS